MPPEDKTVTVFYRTPRTMVNWEGRMLAADSVMGWTTGLGLTRDVICALLLISDKTLVVKWLIMIKYIQGWINGNLSLELSFALRWVVNVLQSLSFPKSSWEWKYQLLTRILLRRNLTDCLCLQLRWSPRLPAKFSFLECMCWPPVSTTKAEGRDEILKAIPKWEAPSFPRGSVSCSLLLRSHDFCFTSWRCVSIAFLL